MKIEKRISAGFGYFGVGGEISFSMVARKMGSKRLEGYWLHSCISFAQTRLLCKCGQLLHARKVRWTKPATTERLYLFGARA